MSAIPMIAEVCAGFLECVICLYFLIRYFEVKKGNIYLTTGTCFLLLSLDNILLSQRAGFELISVILSYMILLLFAILFLKGNPAEKFIYCGVLLITIVLINVLVTNVTVMIINMSIGNVSLFHDGSYSMESRMMTLVATKFLFFFVVNILLSIKKRVKHISSTSEWMLMLGLFCVSFYICVSLWIVNRRYADMEPLLYMGSMIGLIIINISLYALLHKLSRENVKKREMALLETNLASQKELIAGMKLQYDEIKILRHDIGNCLRTIKLLSDEDKIDDMKRYLHGLIQDKFENIVPLACTKSNILNTVFNSKMAHCSRFEISFLYEIIDTYPVEMELDLSILLSNLLDNAIEASKKIGANKEIMLYMKQYKAHLNIMVKNHIEKPVLDMNSNLHTTKSDKIQHGYGMRSIQKIVDKYSGTRKVYEKDGFFIVEILLEMKSV